MVWREMEEKRKGRVEQRGKENKEKGDFFSFKVLGLQERKERKRNFPLLTLSSLSFPIFSLPLFSFFFNFKPNKMLSFKNKY